MPSPNRPATDLVNTDLQRENQYDHGRLATIIMNSEPLLTAEQKIFMIGLCWLLLLNKAFFSWMHPVEPVRHLISLILAKIRSQQKIALAVASSGIAATLLDAPDINYSAHSKIAIGGMDKVCQYCHALKFRNEAAGMCYASGKVVLSPLPAQPGAFIIPSYWQFR
ncbi:helitron_like_N domain-containing protein [Trichonephila clavipes]|nr:helitron_like_N domain-containing protein [Trichonephila clavipes]